VCSKESLQLRVIDRDFVAVEKPFALAITVASDAHHATIPGQTEHLNHHPDFADKRWKRPLSLPDLDTIPDDEVALW
jgi:hypothetical protein